MPISIKPNFFIAGAPKCATTSMHRYLKAHPEIYMPDIKELHFFGSDIRRKVPYAAQTQEEYLQFFSKAGRFKKRGEASIYYIYSQSAYQEMHAFAPDAKIIILIREPLEMIYSLHFQHVFNKWCSDPDFDTDLCLQDKESGTDQEKIHYRTLIKRLPENIQNFKDIFGEKNVFIILVDDFLTNTEAVYADTLRFLGVDDTFRPRKFKHYNRNKSVRWKMASSLMGQGSQVTAKVRPLVWKNPILYQWLYNLRYFLFFELNAKDTSRPKMTQALKDQLQEEFRPTIKELEKICAKDLSSWYDSNV